MDEKKLGGKFDCNVKACQIKAARAIGSANYQWALKLRRTQSKPT